MRKTFLIAFLFVAILGSFARAGNPPTLREVEVVGKSGGKDKAGEKAAEDDALKSAVLQVVTDLVGDKAAAEKKDLIASKILGRARRYVPEFRVGERSEAGSTVILKIKAKVSVDLLKADLTSSGVIVVETQARVLTRVIVLPAASKSGSAPWWALGGGANAPEPLTYVLVDTLRAKGFEVTEPRRAEADPAASVTATPAPPPDMTKENLSAVAKASDADVYLRVPWETQVATRALDGVSYAIARAKIGPIEAVAVKDGAVVATASGEGQAAEAFDPMKSKTVSAETTARINEAALHSAAADAGQKLAAALGDPVSKGGAAATIKVVVAGLDSYVAFARFETALAHDLRSVRTAQLSTIERGEVVFDVGLDHGADASGLADEISKKDFSDFSVKVTEKTAERVVLHVGH